MREPVTRLTLEAPGGLVSVEAHCQGGKCESVSFRNVPAFVFGLQRPVEVPALGTLMVDVAYGGMIYAMVDAEALGIRLDPSEARDLVELERESSGRQPRRFRWSIPRTRRFTRSTRPCLPAR